MNRISPSREPLKGFLGIENGEIPEHENACTCADWDEV